MLWTCLHHHHHHRSCSCSCSSPCLQLSSILLVVIIPCFAATSSGSFCNENDQESLLSFSLGISSELPLNWSASFDCCNWEGIVCEYDRVTRLSLPSRGLKGNISHGLVNLSSLVELNLSGNWLWGPLPDRFFASLSRLQMVDLSYNRLSGKLSPSDELPGTIQTMDLSSNHFNGTLEFSLFHQAAELMRFNVSNNSFSGQIPSFICNITATTTTSSSSSSSASISVVDLSLNEFSGPILQGFGECSNLQILRAGLNMLSGPIPNDIYRVSTLQELSLPGNKLTGVIDETVANLVKLRVLSLYGNELTGGIPLNIGRLSNLEQLLLHVNYLNGTLPPSLTNCTKLNTLNLRVNLLQGELSSLDFSKFVGLSTIDLGNNLFHGPLPTSLFLCKSLTAIRLATNNLEGQVLPDVMELKSLSFLSISNNTLTNITAAMRILMGCKNIRSVVLSKNFYGEPFPDDDSMMGYDGFQNLQVLALGGCNLTGQIPKWLANLGRLEVIDLSFNHFTGVIPGWFGNLSDLFYLDLSYNFLHGYFPIELIRMTRLSSQESGDKVDRSYLELPVFVQPNNVSNFQYNQLSNLPPAIYLGGNYLSGNIPIEIGEMKFVQLLDFNSNRFSGNIPDTISNLTNLEILNLSGNNLTGNIPPSLKNLHFLSSFDVANNNLQGPIPTGGQFDTFPSSSFQGNPFLCGRVIQRPCDNNVPATESPWPSSKKSPNKRIIIGLILGICFGISFTLMVLAFWVLTKRRILPKGDHEKDDMDTASYNSTSGLSAEVEKDTSLVILFPNNKNAVKDLSIAEILKATDNFSQANIIGCGGFGLVFKATLANGTKLAVKKLSGDTGLMDREFKAEVEILSTAQHKNLVSLQGYCVHEGSRLLIYSYMENGSLDYWLHEKTDGASRLDWPTRLRIAQGASRGLAYMHQICEPHIVHRDIKSSNILLDDNFDAHVADFGLSRLILPYHTHVTTELVGTLGYIPPEYGQAWVATLRGDIYSFGVVILELLAGKRPVDVTKPKISRELVVWVQQLRNEGKQQEVFDPLLRGKGFENEMLLVLELACMCVNHNPFKRPKIAEVVDWLDNVASDRQASKNEQQNA